MTIPAFKNYQQGEPNENVYIKNLAKQTEISDLRDLFALYFDFVEEMDQDLEVKLMKEGRLKGQSWVNFHSVEKATRAVNEINGYVLHEKPMIVVSYHWRPFILSSPLTPIQLPHYAAIRKGREGQARCPRGTRQLTTITEILVKRAHRIRKTKMETKSPSCNPKKP